MFNVLQNKIIYFFGAVVLILSFVVVPLFANADFNQQINYQGKLTDSSGMAVADGDYNMYFWLIASSTAASSTSVWSEVRTGVDKVQVTNGLFSVMLGEVSSLSGVDFNQTLYLGVEIGGTNSSPTWDGEMSPRKILGAVPAAFEAKNAETLDNLATTSFLRADDVDTMQASSSSALLTLIQNGAGKLFSVFSGVTEMFTISNNGNIGLGTTTPSHKLTVIGNTYLNGSLTLTGALNDSLNASGTSGQILSSTGTSTQWTSTSALGLGNGTFLGLTDTPSSYTANRIMFTNSGATALTDSANLTFDGTNLGIGTTTPANVLTIAGHADVAGSYGYKIAGDTILYASTTNSVTLVGNNAGRLLDSTGLYNTAVGYQALYTATSSDNNTAIGYRALYSNTSGADNTSVGYQSMFSNTTGANNMAMGRSSLYANTTGSNNVAIGYQSLGANISGSSNLAIGFQSLLAATSSTGNVGIGTSALSTTTGSYNTGIGYAALQSNTTGQYNTAIGTSALTTNTTGGNSASVGYQSLYNNTTGSSNVAFGHQSSFYNTVGSNNMSQGYQALLRNTTGSNNVAIGSDSSRFNAGATSTISIGSSAGYGTAGYSNQGGVVIGYQSGFSFATSSDYNTLLGYKSGYGVTTGSRNILLGQSTIASSYNQVTTGSNNISIGNDVAVASSTASNQLNIGNLIYGTNLDGTGSSLSSGNIGIGTTTPSSRLAVIGTTTLNGGLNLISQDGISFNGTRYLYASNTNYSVIFGENAGSTFSSSTLANVAIGYGAGQYASTSNSDNNNFIGLYAGLYNTGSDNNIFGNNTGYYNTGSYNNLFGNTAGRSNTGSHNNMSGQAAGYNNTGSYNNLFGYFAGQNNTGSFNNVLGYLAGQSNTGSYNNLLGRGAGYNNIGNYNEMFGYEAGLYLKSTSSIIVGTQAFRGGAGNAPFSAINNVAIGYQAAYNATTSANNNILLGYQAAYNLTSGANNIVIGYDVDIASTTGSNQLNIGNLIFGTGIDGTGTSISSGNIGIGTTTPSHKLTISGDVNISEGSAYKYNGFNIALASTTLNNYFFGEAGNLTMSGGSNTAIGYQSMNVNTTGTENTSLGYRSMLSNTSGDSNTAIGYSALRLNTSGDRNTAIGELALRSNTAGDYNIGIGYQAGYDIDTASSTGANTVIGYNTGRGITTGVNNTILGANVTGLSATLSNNIIIADGAGNQRINVNSSGNIGLGTTTPSHKLTVIGNTYLNGSLTLTGALNDSLNASGTSGQILSSTGTSTQWTSTSALGLGNGTFLGLTDTPSSYTANRIMFTNSGATALTDSANLTFDDTNLNLLGTTGILFGGDAQLSRGSANRLDLASGDSFNIVSGTLQMGGNTVFYSSTTIFATVGGYQAGTALNGGSLASTAFGYQALSTATSSDYNTAFGHQALRNTSSGYDNVGVGVQALFTNTTGHNNSVLGEQALYSNTTGSDNVAVGSDALKFNVTGSDSVAVGYNSLFGNNLSSTTVAIGSKTAYGSGLLYNNQGGVYIGFEAGYSASSSSDFNTLIGYQSGYGVTTGSRNILLGQSTIASSYNQVTTGSNNISIGNDVAVASSTASNQLNIGNLIYGTNLDGTGSSLSSGGIGVGTSTPLSRLSLEKTTFSGNGVAGIHQYIKSTNSTASAVQYGDFSYIYASNTATTTIAGGMLKIEDRTLFGNTIRGFEVQTERGTNTLGENTALSGFARTFGVRGTTEGDAGGTYEPAGVFAETRGTTQGNAIRGYSSSITTTSLLKLFQDTSTFVGTGLLMNFGNSGGSFSSTTASKFIDLQNAGTSMFTVGSYGKLTIGDGTTNNNAGIQVGYGGICVDNDGTCTASTTGRVSAVSYHTGNSDLAEMYFSNESLKTGEIVYIKNGLSVGRADESSEGKIIGVVSTKPGQLLGFDDTSLRKGEQGYPIALKGRVPIRLSDENGEIKAGDELMLSSVPGVAMKASSTGKVVGIALENYDGLRAYSDTYINQFGDDLVDPVFEPINKDNDPRIDDGCYYGGGNASGDKPCIPLKSVSKDDQVKEAEALVKREAEERELAKLAKIESETKVLANGQVVKVGQIVMFVDLRNRDLGELGAEMVLALTANTDSNNEEENTIWKRLVNLANNFVDGVLSVFTLKADRVEINNQLCVDGVCVTGEELRQMLNKNNQNNESPVNTQNDIPAENNQNNESENNTNNEQVTEESSVTQEEIPDTNNTSVEVNQEEESVSQSENGIGSVIDEEEESVIEEGVVEAESVNDSSEGESDEASI
jgi:hypothetical protein